MNPIANFSVLLTLDNVVEESELFSAVIITPRGAVTNVFVSPSMANVTILDSTGSYLPIRVHILIMSRFDFA